jgi:hypothetical protein
MSELYSQTGRHEIASEFMHRQPTLAAYGALLLALTRAWFFGYVRPDRRGAASLRACVGVIIAAGSFEIIYISWQAGHGGGDLRIAHFLGIHAQQAIPVLGLLIGRLSARLRWPALIGGSAAYALLTVALFIQAVQGRALLPGWF